MSYAIIVTSKEALAYNKTPITKEGDRFWVTIEEGGWAPATSRMCLNPNNPPEDLKTFRTREAAEKFARKWKGHPWWCVPKSHEIVEVRARMARKQDGWKVT